MEMKALVSEEEKRKRSPILKTLKRAIVLVWKSGNITQLVLTSIWLVMGAFMSFTAVFNRNFLDAVAKVIAGKEGAFSTAVFWLMIWGGMEIAVSLVNIFSGRAVTVMWHKVALYVEEVVIRKAAKIRIAYFDDKEDQRKIGCVKGEFSERVSAVTDGAFKIMRSLISFVTVFFIILNEKPVIALILIGAAVPAIWISHRQTEESYYAAIGTSFEVAMQNYLSWLLIRRKYMKEMRFYNLYDYVNKRFDESVDVSQGVHNKLAWKYSLAQLAAMVIQYAALAVSLLLITMDILDGTRGIGSFVLIYSSAQNLQGSMNSLFASFDMIGSEGRYLEDYETVMDFEEECYDEDVSISEGDIEIDFRDVHFTYPGSDREILKGINLKIRQGEKIAVIGENGSGKSTFISLLNGLYSPSEGQILVNGQDMNGQLGMLRKKMSCTLQDFGQYDFTIADNVRIGDMEQEHTPQEIREALEKAGLLEYVDTLKEGMETPLGNHAKGSVDLSGGQWQKLAMARNLIRKEARIMLMDEPTAALDPVAESKLYQEFQSLTGDRTVLLVSHRLGATRLADRVLVFSDGRIVEDGTHDELLKQKGLYAQMYTAQSQWYV